MYYCYYNIFLYIKLDKFRSCGLLHQLYADDIQAYIHCNAADAVASVGLMCSAIDALSKWMASNRLLLNPSKTQFIWLGGRRQLA